jgi:hypothetical protein
MPRDEMGKMPKNSARRSRTDAARPRRTPAREPDFDVDGQWQRRQSAHQLPAPAVARQHRRANPQGDLCDCWNEWFRGFSIKVINETRIDLSTEFGQHEYDKHMHTFLRWEEEEETPA